MNKPVSRGKWIPTCLAATMASIVSTSAFADDIDIYTSSITGKPKPNILFVLDYSGSMRWDVKGRDPDKTGRPARIDILKNAMDTVLSDSSEFINAGVGSLFGTSTTGIGWPISELNADANAVDPRIPAGQFTVKDIISKQINERGADGWTATVDALVEASQYFQGEALTHNDQSDNDNSRNKPNQWNVANERYEGGHDGASIAASYSPNNAYTTDRSQTYYCNDYSASGGPNYCEDRSVNKCVIKTASDSRTIGFENQQNLWGNYQRCEYARTMDWVGARYNSPVTQSCQVNAIVLISDGKPTRINDGDSLRLAAGSNVDGCEDLSKSIFKQKPGKAVEGNCGPEILKALAKPGLNPLIPQSHVKTYTVGFNIDGAGQDYLKLLADAGQGVYFNANTPEQLSKALTTVIDDTLDGSENFAELTIDVDKASFSHDNRAFFSLFTPSYNRAWQGNLKGYFVERRGLVDINGNLATVSATNNSSQFNDEAQSFWSTASDGNEVTKGGASQKLLVGSRNLYTFSAKTLPTNGALLSAGSNRLSSTNDSITHAIMNLAPGSTQRNASLDWLQTAPMGDPLHSKSVTVNYGAQQVVYIMTNQGLIHAIDATTPIDTNGDSSGGRELFAFMPQRLLANLPALQTNKLDANHIYGLDGQITRWHTDVNNDGIVNGSDSVLLVFGMRRGGNAYYAMDVTNPTAPKLDWMIDGSNPQFSKLAQSWSRMSLINVNDNGATRRALVFAAGFDAGIQDTATSPIQSSGNAIYMIDRNGKLLWQVDDRNNKAMKYSIASDLTVIDSDGDSIADRLYVGDLGGQLWRVDFEDISTTPHVNLLANLHDGSHQPFFYPPSVALNKSAKGDYLSISIGSGNRTNPLLSNVSNKLYMIRDTDVEVGAPSTAFPLATANQLFDATDNQLGSADKTIAKNARDKLDAAPGWFVALSPDEKALSSLVTFEGKLLATTFEPTPDEDSDADEAECSIKATGRYYSMSVSTAEPVSNVTDSSGGENGNIIKVQSRSRKLNSSGIPSSPVVVFPKGSGVVQVIVDKETVNLIDQRLARIFWHAK